MSPTSYAPRMFTPAQLADEIRRTQARADAELALARDLAETGRRLSCRACTVAIEIPVSRYRTLRPDAAYAVHELDCPTNR